MKSRSKVLSLILATAMCVSMLGGCASGKKGGIGGSAVNSDVTDTADDRSATAETGEAVKLKWYMASPVGSQADSETVQKAVSDYVNETYGLNIELELIFSDYASHDEKMQMVIAGGEEYDLCYTSSWCNNYSVNVGKNAYIPLDELIEQYGKEMYESIPEGLWQAAKMNGEIYAVPNYQVVCKQPGLCIPNKYIEEFGLDVSSVKSIYDLEDFMYAVKAEYPDIYPLAANSSFLGDIGRSFGYEYVLNINYPGGFKLGDESLKVYNVYESEEMMKIWEHMYKWAQDGLIKMDAIGVQDRSVADLQAGINIIGGESSCQPGIEESRWKGYFGGQDCTMITICEPMNSTASILATLTSISTTSKHPELAMQLLNLVNSDPVLYNMLCFGIEGTHYTLNDNGTVTSNDTAGYNPNCDWAFGNQFNAYPRDNQSPDIWDTLKAFNDSAVDSNAMGFIFDSAPVESELAAISVVTGEYLPQLAVGAVDPKVAVPEMMKRLEDAGMDVVIEEMQRQVDEWKASK